MAECAAGQEALRALERGRNSSRAEIAARERRLLDDG